MPAKIRTKTTLKEHTSKENNAKSIFCYAFICFVLSFYVYLHTKTNIKR